MANDVQVFDGFRYEFEEAVLWRADRGVGDDVVVLKIIDDDRGVEAHAYFSKEAWEEFNKTINGGVLVPSPDALRRLGV